MIKSFIFLIILLIYPIWGDIVCGDQSFSWIRGASKQGPNVCVSRTTNIIRVKNETTSNLTTDASSENPNRGDLTDMIDYKQGSPSLNFNCKSSWIQQNCRRSANYCLCKSRIETDNIINETNTLYECCHGYLQVKGQSGCPKKLELKSLLETLKEHKFEKMLQAISELGLEDELNKGNFTLFALSDDVLGKEIPSFQDAISNNLPGDTSQVDSNNRLAIMKSIIMGHIVPGIVKSSAFETSPSLPTLLTDPTPAKIYMDQSAGITWTANCVPLIEIDIMAENGVIHPIDRLMVPARESIYDILKQPQFSRMLKLLDKTSLAQDLRTTGGNKYYTLFAVKDDAFDNVDPALMARMDKGDDCALIAIEHHVIPLSICSNYIRGSDAKTPLFKNRPILWAAYTMGDNVSLVQTDLPALNGLIHVVDRLIVPPETKPLLERLEEIQGIKKFTRLIRENPEMVNNSRELFLYIPTDSTFDDLGSDVQNKLKTDKNYQRSFVANHMVPDMNFNRNNFLVAQSSVKTIAGRPLIAHYESFSRTPYALQCSRLVSCQGKSCDTKYYQVDKVIEPILGDDWNKVVERYPEISRFVSLLIETNYKEADPNVTYTIYAPSNDILSQEKVASLLSNEKLPQTKAPEQELTSDQKGLRKPPLSKSNSETATEYIKNHIEKGYQCCFSMPTFSRSLSPFQFPSLSGSFFSNIFDQFNPGQNLDQNSKRSKIATCDIPITGNMVLHILNGTIESPKSLYTFLSPLF